MHLRLSTIARIAWIAFCVPLPAQIQGTVHTGTAPASVRLSAGWPRALAVQPGGSLWCLVYEDDGSGQVTGRKLLLFESADSGASWVQVADTPTTGDGRGAVVADVQCERLHVTWHATNGGVASSLYYQEFDTASRAWIGSPALLLQGTNSNDQYYPNDIALTEQGTVGISFNAHRSPLLSGFSGWSGGLLVLRRSDTSFQGPFRLNTDSFGMLASLQAVGEVFHVSFRTNTGLYGIQYRAFDSAGLQFLTSAEVPLYGTNQSNMRATNSSSIAADAADNLYVLYSVGSPNPAGGALEVAFAQPGSGYGTWSTALVESDSALQAGNVTYQHFSLARGEGGTVYAVFSKASESHQNLYARILSPDPVTGGVQVVPDPATAPALPLLTSTQVDSFQRVDGLRAELAHTGLMVAYSGAPASQPAGQVGFFLSPGAARTVEWGLSCNGSLPDLPRLGSQTLPRPGTSYVMELTGAPPGGTGVLYTGFGCLPAPFDLSPLGFTGCSVWFQPALTVGLLVAGPGGGATFPIPLPAGLTGGFEIQFGAFLLAPGATPGGAVVTNALSSSVR